MTNVWSVAWTASCLGLRGAFKASSAGQICLGTAARTRAEPLARIQPFRGLSSISPVSVKQVNLKLTLCTIIPTRAEPGRRRTIARSVAEYATKRAAPPPRQSIRPSPKKLSRSGVRELSHQEITDLFGPTVDKDLGNQIIGALQQQRISGTLDKGIPDERVNDHIIANALAWLRQRYPVDEDAAILKRIEEEERQYEQKLVADAERLGL